MTDDRPPEGIRLPPPPKRTPPPDATGEEAKYLLRLKDQKTRVTVVLNDGETFTGWVEYYDREMVKINREPDAGPNVFIRKVHVRYLYEDPAR